MPLHTLAMLHDSKNAVKKQQSELPRAQPPLALQGERPPLITQEDVINLWQQTGFDPARATPLAQPDYEAAQARFTDLLRYLYGGRAEVIDSNAAFGMPAPLDPEKVIPAREGYDELDEKGVPYNGPRFMKGSPWEPTT